MKKSKFYFNQIGVVLILTAFLSGCSSQDDSGDSDLNNERTIISMEPSVNSDIDWNDVKLVWNEEFTESTNLDDIWDYQTGDAINPGNSGGLQIYQKDNVELSEGKLKIIAKEKSGVYTSARLSSKYAFKYGRIEISAKFPEEVIHGIWAKINLLGNDINEVGYPQAGEIDMVEYFSNNPNRINNYIHSTANNADNGTLLGSSYILDSAEEEFHAYGLLWTDKYIKFYIDSPDNITYTFLRPSSPTGDNWPFDKPFYLLTGMAIGGGNGGEVVDASLFPGIMEIDYIRVYHPD